MVGFLGAVLGGCCFGCPKQRCLVPWLDLHVRFSMGEVLTAVWIPQLTTRKHELQITAAHDGHKAKLLFELVLMVTWKVWRRVWERSNKSMKKNIDRLLFFVADNHIRHQKSKISQNVWPWPVTMPQMAPVSHCWSVTWKSFPSLNWNCFGAVRHHRHRHVLRW